MFSTVSSPWSSSPPWAPRPPTPSVRPRPGWMPLRLHYSPPQPMPPADWSQLRLSSPPQPVPPPRAVRADYQSTDTVQQRHAALCSSCHRLHVSHGHCDGAGHVHGACCHHQCPGCAASLHTGPSVHPTCFNYIHQGAAAQPGSVHRAFSVSHSL